MATVLFFLRHQLFLDTTLHKPWAYTSSKGVLGGLVKGVVISEEPHN